MTKTGVLSNAELWSVLGRAGFPSKGRVPGEPHALNPRAMAFCIARAESGGNPEVNADGMFQKLHGAPPGALAQSRQALAMSGGGLYWAPWCTAFGCPQGQCGHRSRGDSYLRPCRGRQPAYYSNVQAALRLSRGRGNQPGDVMISPQALIAVRAARAQLGVPYVYADIDPRGGGSAGFDCSGLSTWCYRLAGIALPHQAQAQFDLLRSSGREVSGSDLLPGDLVFFTGSDPKPDVGHVGIYQGGGYMIDANHTGGRIDYRTLYSDMVGAGRPAPVRKTEVKAPPLPAKLPAASGGVVTGDGSATKIGDGPMPSVAQCTAWCTDIAAKGGSQNVPECVGLCRQWRATSEQDLLSKAFGAAGGSFHQCDFLGFGMPGWFCDFGTYLMIGAGGLVLVIGAAVLVVAVTGSQNRLSASVSRFPPIQRATAVRTEKRRLGASEARSEAAARVYRTPRGRVRVTSRREYRAEQATAEEVGRRNEESAPERIPAGTNVIRGGRRYRATGRGRQLEQVR